MNSPVANFCFCFLPFLVLRGNSQVVCETNFPVEGASWGESPPWRHKTEKKTHFPFLFSVAERRTEKQEKREIGKSSGMGRKQGEGGSRHGAKAIGRRRAIPHTSSFGCGGGGGTILFLLLPHPCFSSPFSSSVQSIGGRRKKKRSQTNQSPFPTISQRRRTQKDEKFPFAPSSLFYQHFWVENCIEASCAGDGFAGLRSEERFALRCIFLLSLAILFRGPLHAHHKRLFFLRCIQPPPPPIATKREDEEEKNPKRTQRRGNEATPSPLPPKRGSKTHTERKKKKGKKPFSSFSGKGEGGGARKFCVQSLLSNNSDGFPFSSPHLLC